MPGVMDFLFEGRPPSSVNTYGQTVENIPKWLSDYTQGMIGRANVIAAEPYIPYEGPRIAGFSPDQLAAFDNYRSNVGNWSPLMQGAAETTMRGAGIDPFTMGAPAMYGSMQQFPDAVDQYMDPYIQNVLDRQETLSNRNLTENIIPAMQDAFVGSGSFGGDRMAEIAGRISRDTAEGLQGQQLATLSEGYRQAGALHGQDMSRWLQAGMGLGNLAGQTGELQLSAGRDLGALAEALQGLQFKDVAGIEAIGRQYQDLSQRGLDLAYSDFQQQRDYPRDTIDWMNSVIRGIPYSRATQTTDTGPASVYGPSPLSQLTALYSTYKGLQPPGNTGG